jgi:hypothetical protein
MRSNARRAGSPEAVQGPVGTPSGGVVAGGVVVGCVELAGGGRVPIVPWPVVPVPGVGRVPLMLGTWVGCGTGTGCGAGEGIPGCAGERPGVVAVGVSVEEGREGVVPFIPGVVEGSVLPELPVVPNGLLPAVPGALGFPVFPSVPGVDVAPPVVPPAVPGPAPAPVCAAADPATSRPAMRAMIRFMRHLRL